MRSTAPSTAFRPSFATERFDYGEDRFRAYGDIDGLAYCLVFTFRDGLRPISLRRATTRK
ncbi:BrnT family toxin [Rhodopseudomonas parapalustris]